MVADVACWTKKNKKKQIQKKKKLSYAISKIVIAASSFVARQSG